MELTGAQIVIECLKEQGVDTVFGYPGGAILNVYDELYKHKDEIHHVLTSHEQGAAHAADGYARSTGKVGVCMATSGPGATNLVTGIATAQMDSVPMVAITCNVGVSLLGKDSFQEVDITGVTMPITKHSFIVKDVNDLADTIRRAFDIARSGRPGPVLVDIPKDVQIAECEYEPACGEALIPELSRKHPAVQLRPEGESLERYKEKVAPFIEKAAELISRAERPLIYFGGGVILSGAQKQLLELAERMDAPAVSSLMGLGAMPHDNPRMLGMLGMHGTHAANIAMQRCDLLVAVGVRFSDRALGNAATFAPNAKVLHIDVDRAEINKNVTTTLHITGDARIVLELLLPKLSQSTHEQWNRQAGSMAEEYLQNDFFEPRKILKEIARQTPDVYVATDVGQHQMWTAQYFPFRFPRQLITSGGLGTMGFGLGAAMGASEGCGKQVVLVTGDGSFRMNLTELSTIAYYNLPVTVVIFNNGTLGMVRQWQTLFFGHRYSQTTLDRGPDFQVLAKAYSIPSRRVTSMEEFTAAYGEAVAQKGPFLIECMLDIDEMVAPMVAPGSPIDTFCLN